MGVLSSKAEIEKIVKIHDRVVGTPDDYPHYSDIPARVVDFAAAEQAKDITVTKRKGLMENVVNPVHFPFRSKMNIRTIDEEYVKAHPEKGYEFVDPLTATDEEIISELADTATNFDFPVWFANKAGDLKRWQNGEVTLGQIMLEWNEQLTFQYPGCNFHCYYCFVPNKDNHNFEEGKTTLTASEIHYSYQKHAGEGRIKGIRCSGGETSFYLDHIHGILRHFKEQGNPTIAEFDTNLSTVHYIEHMMKTRPEQWNDQMMKELAEGTVVLASFKSSDDVGIRGSTDSSCTLEDQFKSLEFLVSNDFDVYLHLYYPKSRSIESFVDKLHDKFGVNALRRLHCYPVFPYGTVKDRLAKLGMNVDKVKADWDREFEASTAELKRVYLEKYGVEFPEALRPLHPIKL